MEGEHLENWHKKLSIDPLIWYVSRVNKFLSRLEEKESVVEQVDRYAQAGVDIDKANKLVERIKPIVASTFKRGVLTEIGGFAGMFALDTDPYKEPVLVSSTDGVGTKLKIAIMTGIHDTVGIDLVAMCVNDILVTGAKPLFFLDYFATGKLDPDVGEAVIKGVAQGCKEAGCSLIGGETAEMPGMYAPGEYDLAGFVVGVVDRSKIIDGSEVGVGQVLIGLGSSGLHSNGFSLVRKILFEELGLSPQDTISALGDRPLGEILLTPTRIYANTVANLLKQFRITGMVHITGGGFMDNIPRILPNGCKAVIKKGAWPIPAIFQFLQDKGEITEREMCRTFNCGIGMVLVAPESQVNDLLLQAKALEERAFVIGHIEARKASESPVVFTTQGI